MIFLSSLLYFLYFLLFTSQVFLLNHNQQCMFIRDGRKEPVRFDKITARVQRLCYGLNPNHVEPVAITQKVISGVYQGLLLLSWTTWLQKLLLQ